MYIKYTANNEVFMSSTREENISPITRDIPQFPIRLVYANGKKSAHHYELQAIYDWIVTHKHSICPMSKLLISDIEHETVESQSAINVTDDAKTQFTQIKKHRVYSNTSCVFKFFHRP